MTLNKNPITPTIFGAKKSYAQSTILKTRRQSIPVTLTCHGNYSVLCHMVQWNIHWKHISSFFSWLGSYTICTHSYQIFTFREI